MKKTVSKMIMAAIILFAGNVYSQSYEIKIKFKNLKNDTVILGHHFVNQYHTDDTLITNKKGEGTFKKNKILSGGMFFLVFPGGQFLDFILDKDQQFSIEGDTADLVNSIKIEGSQENTVFMNYQSFMTESGKKRKSLNEEKIKFKGDKKKLTEIKNKEKILHKKLNEHFEKTIKENPDMFFTKFLKATKNVEVPKEITDRKEQYYYFRNHYFDNFDVSDPRLLRTPIFKSKINTYLDKVLSQNPDTLIKEVDILINKARTNDELFRFMLVHLFVKYGTSKVMSSENVRVYIAEKYYIPESKWSKKKYIEKLKGEIAKTKKCLIGNKAENITFQIPPADTLKMLNLIEKEIPEIKEKGLKADSSSSAEAVKHNRKVELLSEFYEKFQEEKQLDNIKAKYIILWFWTPDCSHCRTETPAFYKKYTEENYKEKGLEVVAIFLNKDVDDWKKFNKILKDWLKFLKKNKMTGWINGFAPFDKFRHNFDINSSPVLYLLDKDKKIIAKRLGPEQALEIINEMEKEKK